MRPIDATIIVVNYQGGGGILGACLDAVALQSAVDFEVIVVDNASPDGSADVAEGRPSVRLLRNARNVGFGAACNQGAALARGRHLAFLNYDSVPEPGWLAALVRAADQSPDIGAVQGIVLLPGGRVNTAGNLQHFLGFSWAPAAERAPEGLPYEIACGSGASLLVPRARFEEVDGFWEDLFLYGEDTDLSWRLRLQGLRIVACPDARSEHAYEFGRNPEKFFHLERNRLLVLGSNYETATLVRLAPLLLATEAALLVVAARAGWLPQKLRALRAVAAALPALQVQRRRVQATRRVGDSTIARRFETRLGPEFGASVAAISGPPLAAYARLVNLGAQAPAHRAGHVPGTNDLGCRAVNPLGFLRDRAGAGRDVARHVVFSPAGRVIERTGLADPIFRAYEKLQARRAGALPERGADGLPLPPAHLQILVAGHASATFEQDGANGADSIRQIVRRTGGDISGCRAVLDFGVGCARIARHWARIDGPEWHGCDYNETLVAWCRANLPFLQTVRNDLDPPLPYPDGRFDLVYAYSVFTHLPEPLQHSWIAELVRVLEPGGRLMFTTHGDAVRDTMEHALAERYDRGEFAVRFGSTPGSNLCSAFHPEAWVRTSLIPQLEELDLQRGGAPGLGRQDIWTVRKPATS